MTFLALHQHVLSREGPADIGTLDFDTTVTVLRALLSCCQNRILSAEHSSALVAAVTLLVRSVEPEDA